MVELIVDKISQKIDGKSVLNQISFEVHANDFVVITGRSGSGKTTLLNVISGLTRPDSGQVYLDGQLIGKNMQKIWRNQIRFIFQNNLLLEKLTVKQNILMGAKFNKSLSDQEIRDLLAKVGMPDVDISQRVSTLSGGEQQRVALLRTLVKRNELIFADEPTGNLDDENARKLVEILKNWSLVEQHADVMVTHNLAFITYATKHVAI